MLLQWNFAKNKISGTMGGFGSIPLSVISPAEMSDGNPWSLIRGTSECKLLIKLKANHIFQKNYLYIDTSVKGFVSFLHLKSNPFKIKL